MTTTFQTAKSVTNDLIEKNRRSTTFPAMEIEVEVREDTDEYIDFYKTYVTTDCIKIKRNWRGIELLYMNGYHITAIDSNSHKILMEHIKKLKPLSRKLK